MTVREPTMRPYQVKDIEFITEMCMNSIPDLPNYKGTNPSRERIRFLLQNNLTNAMFLCLIVVDPETDRPVGGIAAWAAPMMLGTEIVTQDVYLYVKPEWRSLKALRMLLRGYVEWGQARGATLIQGSFTSGIDNRFGAILEREGFVPVGTLYHWKATKKGEPK